MTIGDDWWRWVTIALLHEKVPTKNVASDSDIPTKCSSIYTLGICTLGIYTLSIYTLSIYTLGICTLGICLQVEKSSIDVRQHILFLKLIIVAVVVVHNKIIIMWYINCIWFEIIHWKTVVIWVGNWKYRQKEVWNIKRKSGLRAGLKYWEWRSQMISRPQKYGITGSRE